MRGLNICFAKQSQEKSREGISVSGVSVLRPVPTKMLVTLSAGDEVALKTVGSRLTVETMAGDYLADVEPKLALRLTRLIAGGNKYAAAVAGLNGDSVRIIIKETFQHPTQVGRLSFPAGKAGDVVRLPILSPHRGVQAP